MVKISEVALLCVLAGVCGVGGAGYAQQQSMPGMQMPPPPQAAEPRTQAERPGIGSADSDKSITLPFESLQEPEAVGFQTGTNLPAPELLSEVARRPPLGLESFLEAGEAGNPTLREAQANIERSGEQARQRALAPNPTFGYSGDHIRGGSYHGGEQGAYVADVFVLGRKLSVRRDAYLAEGRANEFALEVQRMRVRGDLARSFYHALAAQESVVIYDRLLQWALDAETNAHELERVGQADATDVLSSEIAAEQAKADFEQAQRTYLASFGELAAISGQGALVVHPLAGELTEPPELDADALVTRGVQESPYVQVAKSNKAVAEARLKEAERERVPDLEVKAGEWYSGEELNIPNRKAGWESFAEAGVQIPLWNRNQGNIGAARVLVERAQQETRRAQLWTENETRAYAEQYLAARAAAERYRTGMLPRARRAFELEATKYQQMAQSYPQVLNAQHMLYTLQLGYVQALDREWRAAVALQNYGLANGLDAPLDSGEDSIHLNLPHGTAGH